MITEVAATAEVVKDSLIVEKTGEAIVEATAVETTELARNALEVTYKHIIDATNSILDKAWEINENEFYATYKERIDKTPLKNGMWEGERGESKFIPDDPKVVEKLNEYGMDGVEYKNGVPNFSKCTIDTAEIEMTEVRYSRIGELGNRIIGNFEKFERTIAEKWNEEMKNGRTDWTFRDVEKWIKDNNYTIHEEINMKTCRIMPREIHDACNHWGGVAECKKRLGGIFDEL